MNDTINYLNLRLSGRCVHSSDIFMDNVKRKCVGTVGRSVLHEYSIDLSVADIRLAWSILCFL